MTPLEKIIQLIRYDKISMVKGIIFDLDGLLVDSEPLTYLSYFEALKEHDIKLHEKDFINHWVIMGGNIKDYLKKIGVSIESSQIRKRKTEIYLRKIKSELKMMPFAYELLEKLSSKYKLALVTGSKKNIVDAILSKFNLRIFFEIVITRDDVMKGKPDPEGFLLASKKLKLNNDELLVIEDASKGIMAATSVSIPSIAIPNKYTENESFDNAIMILNSLETLDSVIHTNF